MRSPLRSFDIAHRGIDFGGELRDLTEPHKHAFLERGAIADRERVAFDCGVGGDRFINSGRTRGGSGRRDGRDRGRKGRSKEGQRQKSGGEKVDGSAQERSQNALFVARSRKRDGERIPAIVGRPNVEHKSGSTPCQVHVSG